MRTRTCLVAALMLTSGCSVTRGKPFDSSLVGKQMYLCCSMGFNVHFAASDSNYGQYMVSSHQYTNGPMLAAGTRVTVTEVGASGVAFQPEGSDQVYTLFFSYGRKQLSPNQYFGNILRTTNPIGSVSNASKIVATGINQGQLVEGMTKEQALLARGYPPAHRTPSTEANEWVYFETPGFVDRVVFVDGKIQSVTRGPAPE